MILNSCNSVKFYILFVFVSTMEEVNFGDDSSYGGDPDEQSGNIRRLSKDIVKKIAAGQIIPTLSNVVKELIENSIDANATTIDIRFKEHGKELIEVNDNGEGIEESNFASLALAHYTSKLQSIDELGRIKSFGFRWVDNKLRIDEILNSLK